MMVFFLHPNEHIYARYCGRDAEGPDMRQSLNGLRYTMQSVLKAHEIQKEKIPPRKATRAMTVRDYTGRSSRRCYHCHQVKEAIHGYLKRNDQWSRDRIWRYPMPDNLGMIMEVDRGNVVDKVLPQSAAAQAGLKKGDLIRLMNGIPIHSIADAQFALDKAPKTGSLNVTLEREKKEQTAKLTLKEGWRKSDITWRPSIWHMVPSIHLYGNDLSPEEKKAIGLRPEQLAFRQSKRVHSVARLAGARGGDIILGINNKKMETDVVGLLRHVEREYLVGDRITIQAIRNGKKMSFPMTLRR